MEEDKVMLSKEEYDSLVEDSLFLEALQGAGVDNWEGYSYACEIYREDKERAENE